MVTRYRMSPDEADMIEEIIFLHDQAFQHYMERDDAGWKGNEGAVEVYYGNYFDREWAHPAIQGISIYSYALGPGRMHHFDSLTEALTEVRKWHEEEMNESA